MSSIDEIKARIDVVDLISETVTLRRSGKNHVGFCPFHPNSRTPAFVVFQESGTWRCFGQCNEGGDIFRFVMKKEGWDFSQALHYLAEKAGVVLEQQTPQKQAEGEEFEKLHLLLEEAVTFFRWHMTQTAPGRAAQAYLEKRGLTPATIESFGLGYAPESWDALIKHFAQKGRPPEDLAAAGLVSERDSGGIYDRFRNRITFPIRDALGKMVGFGARILNPEDQPKFLNSPQTVLFDKGRLLYALDAARKPIRALDQVVIVEGYLDAIALHQAGFNNAVSPMGTALTEDQLRMLKRFTRRIILALDPDAAGQKATLRGLEIARQAMDHTTELAFDARGLLRHEGRLQADIRVTTLPEGKDPDDVVLKDPDEWRRIVAAAKPVVVHVMETLAAGQDIEDPKVKSDIAAQVMPLIADVGSPVERDAYRQRLARLLRVDERALLGAQPTGGSLGHAQRRRPVIPNAPPQKPKAGLAAAQRAGPALGGHCLRLLLRQPEMLYNLDRLLQKAGLGRFSPSDFEAADHQLLARLVVQALDQDAMEPAQYLQETLPDQIFEVYREYLLPFPEGEPSQQESLEILFRTLMRLRKERVKENLEQLRSFSLEAPTEQDALSGSYNELTMQYAAALNKIDRALKQPVVMD
jgi:DNA primase